MFNQGTFEQQCGYEGQRCGYEGQRCGYEGRRCGYEGRRCGSKGNDVDTKGDDVDTKGNDVDTKGNNMDTKGNDVDTKGNAIYSLQASDPGDADMIRSVVEWSGLGMEGLEHVTQGVLRGWLISEVLNLCSLNAP
eukprot:556772-Pyramimonas_sp.AAC.1